ncbi:hypothetical protein [Coleofasciculus sp.]|uniref:hypothetical protein n=1 Tax=Coleofasciculus sp. TaxID=3100458 RepID=UPI0040641CE3
MCWSQFLAGYVRLFGDASIRLLKPLLGKGCQTNSLPIGSNRISWKLTSVVVGFTKIRTLPIGSNRISWKLDRSNSVINSCLHPYRLG